MNQMGRTTFAGLRRHCRFGMVVALTCFLFAVTGCTVVRQPATQTQALFRTVETKMGLKPAQTAPNALSILQSEVMREADNYATGVAQAADDLAAKVGTPEAKMDALQWKLQQATAAYMNGTGESPPLNVVDMAVLSSLSLRVVESYWVGQKYGAAAAPLLETQRKLDTDCWSLLNEVLTPGQQAELRQLIDDWVRKNPDLRYVAAVRLREFAGILGKKAVQQQQKTKPNSLLGMLDMDPLAGLDPAVMAIEQTRLMAERMMYYLERAPMLLSWRVELTTFRITEQPALQQTLSNMTSLSESTAVFATLAKQLPSLINDQRQEAINQIFTGIATERSNIMAGLDSQESKLRTLLPEVRETLATAGTMSTSLDGAIKSLNEFVHYVSPPDTNPPTVSTNSQPFNILDYAKTATDVGVMARDLNVLLASASQSATQLSVLSTQAAGTAERVVDRAFQRGIVLIIVLLVGAVLARLGYRVLENKLNRSRPGGSPPNA